MLATIVSALIALAPVPGGDIVVSASAAKPAIERILAADNLDVDHLSSREVADVMSDIERGAAPADFWIAYQAHVRAWRDYADAKDRGRSADPMDIDNKPDGAAIAEARRRINASFDMVEGIARRYGVKLPATASRLAD